MMPSGWDVTTGGWWQFAAAEAVSAWMAFLFFESLNFAGRSDCRSSVEMANLIVSKTSKHLVSAHPTLCGGFLLVLLMTFIAVANRERAEKKKRETCYFCCHRCTQDISFRKLELENSLISYYSSCPFHACSPKLLCSILQHEALKNLIIHFNHSNWFTCTFFHKSWKSNFLLWASCFHISKTPCDSRIQIVLSMPGKTKHSPSVVNWRG